MTPCDDCGTPTPRPTTIAVAVGDPARQIASASWIVCPHCLGKRSRVSRAPLDYRISASQLSRLTAIARRLFSEERLTGDEMRDTAQQLHAMIEVIFDLPLASTEDS